MATMSWARLTWAAAYRLGLSPWDAFSRDRELIDLVTGPDAPVPGRAIDIGCGRGRNAIYLAAHGWQVVGVDLVRGALKQARRAAARKGVTVDFVAGDVTRLDELGIGGDFKLLIDFGCFHALNDAQRLAYVRAIEAVAAPGALLWMWSFNSRNEDGETISAEEIGRSFPDWRVHRAAPMSVAEVETTMAALPLPLRPLRRAFSKGVFPPPFRALLEMKRPPGDRGQSAMGASTNSRTPSAKPT
ncbi:class I SAM-dependent methyltransferase [Nucisporomicrobium flavum]|uniref:class I SAM-dependent methyltransferase n=1 Tax=Nucisporomicrobium flavum TaxID=2785915 RepID=UPI0018F4CDF1|nr:class I SAM-dependent methyltransferase [Nucisporomicrobium flavum]